MKKTVRLPDQPRPPRPVAVEFAYTGVWGVLLGWQASNGLNTAYDCVWMGVMCFLALTYLLRIIGHGAAQRQYEARYTEWAHRVAIEILRTPVKGDEL